MTGTGTQADPYKVTSWAELMTALPQDGKYAELQNDIDLRGVTITNGQIFIACNLNGKNHAIKNAYLKGGVVYSNFLFKLAYNVTVQNLKLHNWYADNVTIFNGDNSAPSYSPMPSLKNISFTGNLVNGATFLSGEWRIDNPKFYDSDIYIIADDTQPIKGDIKYALFNNCNVKIEGKCSGGIIYASFRNTKLSGKVDLYEPSQYNYAIHIIENNSIDCDSVVDFEVNGSATWTAEFASETLAVNTDVLNNVSITQQSTFINCTALQINDETYLSQNGFPLGEKVSSFSWNDFLNSVRRVCRVPDTETNLQYTINNGRLEITNDTIQPNMYSATEPFWYETYGTYFWYVKPDQRYSISFSSSGTNPYLLPNIIFWKDNYEWFTSRNYEGSIIKTPESITSIGLQVGFVNVGDEAQSGTEYIENLVITEVSPWNIVEGVVKNSTAPTTNPMGAFFNATSLNEIRIPDSVKSIGRYSFANTSLTEVFLAEDCEYYDTSFPSGCLIHGGIPLQ